jgi:putative hydrolase of the HAD superfamily
MTIDKNPLLLFDLGNVIIQYTFDKTFDYWSKVSGISSDTIREKFFADYSDLLWFETGDISETRYRRVVSKLLGFGFSDKEFADGLNAMFIGLTPGIEELLQKLRQRHTLAALTNTNIVHERFFTQAYSKALIHFDKIFMSHRIHARKPEAESYLIVAKYYKIEPGQVVFLDDKEDNIQGAKDCGFQTVLVEDAVNDISRGLKSLGIEV